MKLIQVNRNNIEHIRKQVLLRLDIDQRALVSSIFSTPNQKAPGLQWLHP
jgi:hypothetical protein